MAEGIAKKMLKGIANVKSAGIAAWGSSASEDAIRVMKDEFGIDMSDHKPKDIKSLSLNSFDYIVTMDSYIDTIIRRGYQIKSNKIVSWNIDDPYGKSIEDYRKCASILQNHIQNLQIKI